MSIGRWWRKQTALPCPSISCLPVLPSPLVLNLGSLHNAVDFCLLQDSPTEVGLCPTTFQISTTGFLRKRTCTTHHQPIRITTILLLPLLYTYYTSLSWNIHYETLLLKKKSKVSETGINDNLIDICGSIKSEWGSQSICYVAVNSKWYIYHY